MAQTLQEIQNEIITAKNQVPELSQLTSTCNTAIWKHWVYIVSIVILSLQKRFDWFLMDVQNVIYNLKPGTPRWYINKAKEFQYGFNLVAEQDYYDNTGIAQDIVLASKIIAHASFTEEPSIRMKVAKKNGNDLVKLAPNELQSFIYYVKRYKYAGVDLRGADLVNNLPATITSTNADNLKLSLLIKYNPFVLNNIGQRLDASDTEPIKKAIKAYLQNLDFDGLFSTQKLIDSIQRVEGVNDLHLYTIQTKYGNLPFTGVFVNFRPDSGYLIINDTDLTIIYQPS